MCIDKLDACEQFRFMPQKQKISEYRLKKWYRLLDTPMLDFDCGTLCAPHNDGIAMCCDKELTVPLLFKEEYRWHRKRSAYWKRYPVADRKEYDTEHDFACFCPGPLKCDRKKRALVCRTYPFEPHLDTHGAIVGMTYIYGSNQHCPLIGTLDYAFNPEYMARSIQYWNEVFEVFPDEREHYIAESQRIRRMMKRKGSPVPVFGKVGAERPMS